VTSTSSHRRLLEAAVPDVGANLSLLATLPLFSGLVDDELEALARVTRAVESPQGDDLWREGDEADGLYVIVSGRVTVDTRLPAEREVEIATLGPGGVLGEIPLLGGGRRWATVRVLEDSRLLFLGRPEFGALVSGASPGALIVRRRLVALVCDRLRQRHEALAGWLGGEPRVQAEPPTATPPRRGGARPPRDEYLLRLPFFRKLDRTSAVDVVRRGVMVDLPVSSVVAAEGALANGCWITLNGAVEELIRRGDRVIRVSLAGPGHAFGYLGLIDGRPASVAAATRERSRLLFLPPDEFEALFNATALGAGAFREAIQRDLVRALHASWRPQARLAVGAGKGRV
jgi:CRP-like cAMP-binding protein